MSGRKGLGRRNLARGVGGLAATALGAGTLAAPALAQRRGGEVVIAQQAQPPSLDAATSSAQSSRNITLHIFETLFARDEAGNPMPDLAEGVNISSDGLTYTFPLRRGVKFHNGKVMTSADVKASLERYGRVGASAAIMRPVAAIETPDANTVVVSSRNPRQASSPGSRARALPAPSSPPRRRPSRPARSRLSAPGRSASSSTGPTAMCGSHASTTIPRTPTSKRATGSAEGRPRISTP